MQKVNDWTPCSEKLPDRNVPVLVSRQGRVFMRTLMDVGPRYLFWSRDTITAKDDTAWMPLPDAWEGPADE